MTTFLISYDLHNKKDYAPLYKQLSDWHAVPVLESEWFVHLPSTAVGIRDTLKSLVDSDDSVMVLEIKVASMWATLNAPAAATWLSNRVLA